MAKKKKASKDYFGLGYLVSVILAIIPVTALILGFLTRLKEGHIFCALFRLITGWNVIWLLDLVCMIVSGKIFRIN